MDSSYHAGLGSVFGTDRSVVITSSYISSPLGEGTDINFQSLLEDRSNFTKAEDTYYGSLYKGICQDPKMSDLHDRKVSKVITRKDFIGIVAALKAATKVGIGKDCGINPERISVYSGSACTSTDDLSPYYSLIKKSYTAGQYDPKFFGRHLMEEVSPMVMLQTLMNNILCYVSVALDIRGANTNYLDFQTSGLRSVYEGACSILSGRSDVALVGSSSAIPELFLDPNPEDKLGSNNYKDYLCFSKDGTSPRVKPYDRSRSGTVMSEGACFLVLEEKNHALRRGAPILGEISYMKLNAGGSSAMKEGSYVPYGVVGSLSGTNIDKDDLLIGYGIGARYMDQNELMAYSQVFDSHDFMLYSSSGNFGDMAEAGNISNIAVATKILETGQIPPTSNFVCSDEPGWNISGHVEPFSGNNIYVTGLSLSGTGCTIKISRVVS